MTNVAQVIHDKIDKVFLRLIQNQRYLKQFRLWQIEAFGALVVTDQEKWSVFFLNVITCVK